MNCNHDSEVSWAHYLFVENLQLGDDVLQLCCNWTSICCNSKGGRFGVVYINFCNTCSTVERAERLLHFSRKCREWHHNTTKIKSRQRRNRWPAGAARCRNHGAMRLQPNVIRVSSSWQWTIMLCSCIPALQLCNCTLQPLMCMLQLCDCNLQLYTIWLQT